MDRQSNSLLTNFQNSSHTPLLCDIPQGRTGRPAKSLTLAQAEALLAAAENTSLHAYAMRAAAQFRFAAFCCRRPDRADLPPGRPQQLNYDEDGLPEADPPSDHARRCCHGPDLPGRPGSRCIGSVGYSPTVDCRARVGLMPSELVGVAGFEPAASSSRTKRAAKLRYTPPARNLSGAARDFDSLAETRTRSGTPASSTSGAGNTPGHLTESRDTSVSKLASGRQANLTGAQGDVPSPAETCSQAWPPSGYRCSPRARSRSMPQLVTSVP